MGPTQRRPDKICCVGGREFRIFKEYDDMVGHDILRYPDFQENPEYTDEGRPFRTAVDEGCAYGRPKDPRHMETGDYSTYGDCGGCVFFSREETPWDIIGVCGCEGLRRKE